jgi:SAM-dependent methyltransferase
MARPAAVIDPTARFTGRVEHYIRSRPRYPRDIVDTLERRCGLSRASTIADVGSGTGMLSELFLDHGNRVAAVEPNREMREAAERILGDRSLFRSVAGRAEATTLEAGSVDFVVAGQAFHWFDRDAARREFRRITRPGGRTVLVWNSRETRSTPFLAAYEQLLMRFGTDYVAVNHERIDDEALAGFYGPHGFEKVTFENQQAVDHEGCEGRLLSSSYVPGPEDPACRVMLGELGKIFDTHQVDGLVTFEYTTKMYYGAL